MSLTPGSKVLFRLRGTDAPWLSTDYNGVPLHASFTPDSGWTVHAVPGGGVRLECLSVAKRNKKRYLRGDPATGAVTVDVKAADGTLWVVKPATKGAVRLECSSDTTGPVCLTLGSGGRSNLSRRPTGPSSWHDFIPLPAEKADEYRAAETDGDYSHLIPFGMTKTGKVLGAKMKKPDHPTPTPHTPRERANGDPVALELVAALQPSFNDAEHGAECSDYEEPDDPRTVSWPHNIVSLNTVATPTGIVHQHGEEVKHTPPAGELARCRKLAAEVAAALTNLLPFGGDHPTPFLPFYLVIGKGETPPKTLTGEGIRAAFRGTIYPDTPIDLRPLTHPEVTDRDAGWPLFAAWAKKHKHLSGLTYVAVGYDTCQEPNLPAVFPRLVLGLSKAGSLVGACGTIVQA